MGRHLYILAGQSNMDGMGYVSELPAELKPVQEDVWIYNPNRKKDHELPEALGNWEKLRAGHGTGFRTNGKKSHYSDRFGIELTFAKRLKELRPDRRIALFKYAKGGSSIHSGTPVDWGTWDPDFTAGTGINQWDHFRYQYERALARWHFHRPGETEHLIPSGLLWLQGESDASFSREIALAYPANLRKIVNRIRRLAGNETLPVLIGRISEPGAGIRDPSMQWTGLIQQAQEMFVKSDPLATLVRSPGEHGWIDAWHYDSDTYRELGFRFAEATHRVETGILNRY